MTVKLTGVNLVILLMLALSVTGVLMLKQRQHASVSHQEMQTSGALPPSSTVPTDDASFSSKPPAVPNGTSTLPSGPTMSPRTATRPPARGKNKSDVPVSSTQAHKAAALPRLLELGSDSCRPCQMMQPVLDALRAEYAGKLQVDFIDVWKDATAGEQYGIQAIPTQIFFDASGKEIFRHTGFYPKDKILAKFQEFNIAL